MRLTLNLALLACLVLPSIAAEAPAEPHPFSVHDMLAMDRIHDPRPSPDGHWIAFVVRETDLEANRGRTDLYWVHVEGDQLRRVTTDPAGDWNPRWTPDGRQLLFLSNRSGSAQVWSLPVGGGEAVQVTDLPLDVGNLVVSPDGKRIAFTMHVFPDCESVSCTVERLEQREQRQASGRIYERLPFRHWDTWKDGRRSHLFVMELGSDEEPVDVTKGIVADVPVKPFNGPEDITFTPDGEGLVFATKNVGRREMWSTDLDLYHVPVDGSREPRCLTEDNQAYDAHPVFSPDGTTLAWLAMERPGYESDRLRIKLRGWPDGETRVLTEDWNFSAYSLTFSGDGSTLFGTVPWYGQRALFAFDIDTGERAALIEEGTVRSPSFAGGRIIYGMDSLRSPVELYSVMPDGSQARRITHLNDDAVAAARMGEPEQFTFEGWSDEKVHGYLVRPVDFDPSKKYPVAFLIHGGPQGSFGNDFHYRWNPQAYAGAGYAAVMIDFHGSSGYGQEFKDSIRGDWGGKPLVDLRKGLAAALERYPFLDGERVSALGASYGGYMINWIAGNWPDRFRCLVNHDGNLDERMAYYDTEELWFPEWDHMGTPWSNPEGYEKQNPVNFVQNWERPMLVVHGAKDFRVVETQGMSTFTALQRRGIPSQFLYYPDENHWVLKPHNSIQWHETVLGWLDRWTLPAEDPMQEPRNP
jgi:dipeptidyl aminopeptidase/acylaminoacyl peptidase